MKDLTNADKQKLLRKVKAFLSITWTDLDTDEKLNGFILSSINRLDEIAGAELDYVVETKPQDMDSTYYKMSMLAQDLLQNRVFYLNEKGMDDYEANYRGELTSLYLQGKCYRASQ